VLVSLALIAAACGSDSKNSDATTPQGSTGATAQTPATGGDTVPAGETVPVEATTAPPAGDDERGTTLTLTLPQEPESWNYWEVGANALRVPTFYNVQETLLENLPDGTIQPMLAEAYEVSDDGLNVTFTIREAKFHDGTDLDSADVVYSMNKNAESPLGKLSTAYGNVATVEAVDPRTVKVTLKNPSASFLEEMGNSAGYIVPEDAHETYDLASEMPGTGPYVFGEYKPDTSLTMTRFADYWGDKPYFENLNWLFVDDETAALNGLEAGDYDVVTGVLAEGIDRVATFDSDPKFQVVFELGGEVSYTFLNVNMPELQDIRVRQAIAHAIDRQPHIDAALAGYGDPTCLMAVPYSVPYNSDYCPYPYDVEKAKSLLADAGVPNLTIDFPFVTVAYHPTVMEILVAQLADVGITATTRGEDLTTWLDRTWTQGNYEMSQITDSAPISQFGCKGGREPLGKSSELCIPEFEDKLAASDKFTDRDEYIAAMADLTNTFTDLAWVIPMFAPKTPQVARGDLEGIQSVRINNSFDVRHLKWGEG
jgi:peptide/nickel transport system substrate-binding protein